MSHWLGNHQGILPICQSILDVIQCRINEDSTVIPGAALDSNSLMDGASLGQSLIRQSDSYGTLRFRIMTHVYSLRQLTVFAQQSNHTAVCAPNGILDWRGGNFRQSFLLLNIVENNLSRTCK